MITTAISGSSTYIYELKPFYINATLISTLLFFFPNVRCNNNVYIHTPSVRRYVCITLLVKKTWSCQNFRIVIKESIILFSLISSFCFLYIRIPCTEEVEEMECAQKWSHRNYTFWQLISSITFHLFHSVGYFSLLFLLCLDIRSYIECCIWFTCFLVHFRKHVNLKLFSGKHLSSD